MKVNLIAHQERIVDSSLKTVKDHKVFVSSPSDVDDLRACVDKIFKKHGEFEHKGVLHRFSPFFWESSMTPAYAEDYQEYIFETFGTQCDIFVLMLWKKIGAGGTEAEYAKFLDEYRRLNPKIEFWACVYGKKVSPIDLDTDQLSRVQSLVKSNLKHWVLLGGKQGAIDSLSKFKESFEDQVIKYQKRIQSK